MNNSVIVIDVGSSKIIAVSGERGVNGTFAIDAFSELRYEGFSEGKFFDEAELNQTIINLRPFAILREISPAKYSSAFRARLSESKTESSGCLSAERKK